MSDCRAARVLYACLRRFIHGDSNNLALITRKHAYALVVTYQILGAHRATSTSRAGLIRRRSMPIGVSEPNVLLDLTAGALRTVTEAIAGALYVLAELAAGVLGPSKARRRAPPQLLALGDRVRAKMKTS